MNRFSQSDELSTEGTGECLAPMEDGRWLMSEG